MCRERYSARKKGATGCIDDGNYRAYAVLRGKTWSNTARNIMRSLEPARRDVTPHVVLVVHYLGRCEAKRNECKGQCRTAAEVAHRPSVKVRHTAPKPTTATRCNSVFQGTDCVLIELMIAMMGLGERIL